MKPINHKRASGAASAAPAAEEPAVGPSQLYNHSSTKGRENLTARGAVPGVDFIIRKPELPRYVGLEKSVIADLIARDLFPKPIKPNPEGRVVGWLSSEIAAWQRARAAERDDAIEGAS